jgi:hypothetical protein
MHTGRIAGGFLGALAVLSPAWGDTPPEPGTYTASILVTEVEGYECLDQKGDKYTGTLQYDGIKATKATLRKPYLYDDKYYITKLSLTITRGVGTLSPSGTFSLHLTVPFVLTVTGTFRAKLIFSDAKAFTEKLTVTATNISCTEGFEIALMRTG